LRLSIREAWHAVASARRATASTIVIIALSLTILGILGLVALVLEHEAREARRWISVELFLSDAATDEEIQTVRMGLVRMPQVVDARMVTKQEALERFTSFFDPELMSVLETNPLPRSFLVDLSEEGRSPSALKALIAVAEGWPGVEAVRADVEFLTMLNRFVLGAMVVLAMLLLIVGLAVGIVIARTIGLGIAARRDVVEIQRILGAPEWLVRRPFVLLGVTQGMIGGALAGVLVYLSARVAGLLPLLGGGLLGPHVAVSAAGLLMVGVAVGWWGSRSALATTLPADPWIAPPESRG